MLIDKNLTWKYHIDYIASKISRVVGIISRLRHSVPLNTLIQIYRSLIFPYTYYGIAVWGQAVQVYLKKVFILQKRALRLMFFAGNRISDVFTCSSDVHTYNTRFSDAGNLNVNKSRLGIQLNSFSIFGAKLWNCLKPDLRKLRKKPFKIFTCGTW